MFLFDCLPCQGRPSKMNINEKLYEPFCHSFRWCKGSRQIKTCLKTPLQNSAAKHVKLLSRQTIHPYAKTCKATFVPNHPARGEPLNLVNAYTGRYWQILNRPTDCLNCGFPPFLSSHKNVPLEKFKSDLVSSHNVNLVATYCTT
jgi:hypothetical protein